MPDEEALLREVAGGAANCSKTTETPNESFVELMTTMNDNMTAMLYSMSWMGSSLKAYMMPPAPQADQSRRRKRKLLKTHLMKKRYTDLAMRATVLVTRQLFGK